MQTPHNGSGITVDSWTEGDDAYCAAEQSQSTQFASLLRACDHLDLPWRHHYGCCVGNWPVVTRRQSPLQHEDWQS